MSKRSLPLPVLCLLVACTPQPPDAAGTTAEGGAEVNRDAHSYSRPDEVRVEHIDLELTVDFDTQTLQGSASLDIERPESGAPLVLDTRDLVIHNVRSSDGTDLTYSLGDSDPLLGAPLTIELRDGVSRVVVDYSTSASAAALQWLSPEQTSGDQPFLFSQSQAILARTWVPCQDSPGVRFTYAATVQVPAGLLALMSAENPQQVSPDGSYTFRMPQPIPSYLLALAVGDLQFTALGDHTGVYAEPAMLEAAAWEFADVEAMLVAAEELYGDYAWGRYDILVLPPSFPFGGMENPRLTFATPTILAGDRSLVALIAHELAHSWSGNLATNADWDDFWLNEGFTTYIELRLMEAIKGTEYAQMLAALSYQDLEEELATLGDSSDRTHLRLDLAGNDPDDGMNSIAYDKGALLLRTLEHELGRESLDAFLGDWFSDNAFKSVTTDQLLIAFRAAFPDRDEFWLAVETEWIDGPGIPERHATTDAAAFQVVDQALEAWSQSGQLPPWQDWNTHQRLHFLRNMERSDTGELTRLDEALSLTASRNSELVAQWLENAVKAGYEPAYPRLREFLLQVGRRKFLTPLYTALAETAEGKAWAREVYAEARPSYHSVSQGTIDRLLDWPPDS